MIQQVENPILEIHDLTVSYDQSPVLWNVDLSLPEGKLIGILGPNGAGKSTLIKAIMGLVQASGGYVKIFNKDLEQVRNRISYVPQRESVDWNFPASVLDVVLMGTYGKLGLFKRPGKKEKELAHSCLEKVGMSAFASRQISELSGGQQQRVFIARALAQEADLYLMDEPFAGVDMATETAIFQLLQEMSKEGKTIVVVHHDIHSAMSYFEWIIMLNLHLVASGPKQEVVSEELLRKTYGGKLNLLTKVTDLIRKKEFNPLKN
ncbi:MAG TPA: manganese ABC transporter ATP-binding protein [Algoriphagus sp.]|jgi:manganese/zinc/iron transport system ATP- binding protein|uniref:metal ABC transporter ATP-binding protein n=1 Tax=unclassified Algoriphagus TaxID=2641541 RepID=UPI000C3E11C6|nr:MULTISPECIES: metal ABC transporter ATP-binding protein [unclassified Algoriphagus]MAL11966.1 manganese ABC transporter ATP-binding protein [Algoriphagus sp.]MAN87408.1 manganese ABC transporter ATP-binding protein [Algoriphagus sp.]HAH36002.1 manganese ABC transporter ATP-binding protein [Algoriphagus sp.]HAS57108.1 manganese ABC transporter ATP-binding protein [Algoriphagus sp.]HCD89756.1 manganese ABC transporter ATP-binding protein [Algoriphagus sp.]|tara:strand:- start:7170 stop:7958 length:789 start_codon:yes stop_codon:yes gene_type:complete